MVLCLNVVTVAILTERIVSLAKHFAVHKKDKSGYRGYLVSALYVMHYEVLTLSFAVVNMNMLFFHVAYKPAIQKRKRLLLHLKRHDPEAYKNVVIEKNLFKEAEQLAKYKK